MAGPGVTSYRGFLYQQEFFYNFLIMNINCGDFNIGFEITDDVDIEYKLASISYNKMLIQVKSGVLDLEDFFKIFDNWILETNLSSYKEYKYQLISEKKISVVIDPDFFTKLNNHIDNSKDCDTRSIKRKTYNKLKDFTKNDREEILKHVIKNYKLTEEYSIELIKTEQMDIFRTKCCLDIDTELSVPQKERFDFVKQKIINDLVNNVETRKGYSISNADFNRYLFQGCQKYGNDVYDPDFIEFKYSNESRGQLKSILDEDKLEVKQLKLAERSESEIYDDILKELFYRKLIDYYKEKDINKIQITHEEARANYLDSFSKLDFENKTKSPQNIYFVTTQTPITSKIITQSGTSSFLQKGCYIHMSSQEVNNEIRIKWSV